MCRSVLGLMRTPGVPIGAFDPEGIIFAAGIDNSSVKLFDIRTFDKGCFSSFSIPFDRNSGQGLFYQKIFRIRTWKIRRDILRRKVGGG